MAYKLEQEIALWDPQSMNGITTDPFRTLFVSRVNFDSSESKLRREFESYGPIKQIKMITDEKDGRPRGYCFIEFEHEKDMHCKYSGLDFKLLLLHLLLLTEVKPLGEQQKPRSHILKVLIIWQMFFNKSL